MKDPRLTELAELIVTHSIAVKENEKVLITGGIKAKSLIKELINKTYEYKGIPYAEIVDNELTRLEAEGAPPGKFALRNQWDLDRFKTIDAFIQIVNEENDAEFSDIPAEQWQMIGKELKPSGEYVVSNKKWLLLNYPTNGYAQKAKMSYDGFFDYLLDVCTVDYKKMEQAQKPLKDLMDRTDKVRITGNGTDLTFSIKDIPAVMCFGERNIPDGEVYTAPVKDSVNGTITYNTPSPYQGVTFQNVSLTFENGKIVKATSDKTEALNKILDTDIGARYIGEFALGLNPQIKEPMGDILFDEKIAGSLHFTPGEAYDNAPNGNTSSVHWDMVLIQRPEYGGGEIYFDDVLIRKDGKFVIDELRALNPEILAER